MDSLRDPRLKSRELRLSSEADCGHCPGRLVASVLQEFRKCLCQISLRLLRKFFAGLRTDLVRKEVDLQCNTQKLSPSARPQVVSSWAPHRSHGPVCDHSSLASAASYGSYGSKMRYQCTHQLLGHLGPWFLFDYHCYYLVIGCHECYSLLLLLHHPVFGRYVTFSQDMAELGLRARHPDVDSHGRKSPVHP